MKLRKKGPRGGKRGRPKKDALPTGATYDEALRQRHQRALQAIRRGEVETYEERLDLLALVVWPSRGVERRAA